MGTQPRLSRGKGQIGHNGAHPRARQPLFGADCTNRHGRQTNPRQSAVYSPKTLPDPITYGFSVQNRCPHRQAPSRGANQTLTGLYQYLTSRGFRVLLESRVAHTLGLLGRT